MARILSLKPGSRVFLDTAEYEVLAPASLSSIKARNIQNGEIRVLPIAELSSISSDTPYEPSTPLDCLDETELQIALNQFEIIKPAITRSLTRKEIEELAAKHNIHYTTIYRKIRKYRETMSPASLIPNVKNRGGKGKNRIDKAVDDIVKCYFQEILDGRQLDITKLSIKALHREISMRCRRLSLKPPAWNTVSNRLDDFIHERRLDVKKKRKGGAPRTMAGTSFPDANLPLDVVQIDHTPLDIIIVDEEHREPIGKVFLSIAIDVFSRMVVGFSISLDSPSIFSVGRLIANCMLPKTEFLKRLDIDAEWDIYGKIGVIHLDNASEFRADSFIPFQEEYLTDMRWRPVATPEYGGHIERLAKTLNEAIHQEPGTTMSNIIKRAGYNSEGHACYTIDEIEKWLTILITKIYNVKNHSALKDRYGRQMSPLQKYELGILGDDTTPGLGNPDIIEDPERLKLFLLPSYKRTVQREGIGLEKIKYFHDILRNIYGKVDEEGKPLKFLIKRDPRRISPIYLFDPEQKEYFAIPYRDLSRPPMTYWELEASRKRCNEQGVNDPNEEQIFNAYGELQQIRNDSVAKTKKARREREAEKRRKKDKPVYPKLSVRHEADIAPHESSDDVMSFYDDSLLDGVLVKKPV